MTYVAKLELVYQLRNGAAQRSDGIAGALPQELAFLSSIGFNGSAVSILGIAQLVGGILIFPSKSRLLGTGLASVCFIISSLAIFAGGDVAFGFISALPVAALLAVAYSLRGQISSKS